MSEAETPYTETEFLIKVLNDDEEGARRLMRDMSDREIEELRKAFRKGKWWVEDEQSIRYANDRKSAADGAQEEGGSA